jgi:hypothetical protein
LGIDPGPKLARISRNCLKTLAQKFQFRRRWVR